MVMVPHNASQTIAAFNTSLADQNRSTTNHLQAHAPPQPAIARQAANRTPERFTIADCQSISHNLWKIIPTNALAIYLIE
jgi:hypothetical protein